MDDREARIIRQSCLDEARIIRQSCLEAAAELVAGQYGLEPAEAATETLKLAKQFEAWVRE